MSIDGHFDPRKIVSGRGFENKRTSKYNEKSMRTSKVFDGSEPRLALYSSLISAYFTLSDFLEKVETSMPKGRP